METIITPTPMQFLYATKSNTKIHPIQQGSARRVSRRVSGRKYFERARLLFISQPPRRGVSANISEPPVDSSAFYGLLFIFSRFSPEKVARGTCFDRNPPVPVDCFV